MSDFPNLEPAFTFHVAIDPPIGVGSVSRGTPLSVVPMTDGTIKSEPGFSPAIEAKFKGAGQDYIHSDATGKHMRLNAHAALEYAEPPFSNFLLAGADASRQTGLPTAMYVLIS